MLFVLELGKPKSVYEKAEAVNIGAIREEHMTVWAIRPPENPHP